MSEPNERCYGCGDEAPQHPIIGVGRDTPQAAIEAALVSGKPAAEQARDIQAAIQAHGGFAGYPVCAKCHVTPPRPLKLHYFPRAEAPAGLTFAGSKNLVMPTVESTSVLHVPGKEVIAPSDVATIDASTILG